MEQQVKEIVSVLTTEEQQLLKDTIIYGSWGDADMEFLDKDGNIETDSIRDSWCQFIKPLFSILLILSRIICSLS